MRVKKFFNDLFNIISPEGIKCIICDNELDHNNSFCMCKSCFQKLPTIKKACIRCGAEIFSKANLCLDCKQEQRMFDRALSPFNYEDEIVNLVYRFKYGGEQYLAKYLAFFMIQKIIEENLNFDIIIPVPLSKKRKKLRTFNQAELLAKYIAQSLNKPLDTTSIIRVKDTLTQTHLTKQQRVENLKDAFKVENKDKIKGKKILLVDDIFTTGSTSNEIAKVLKDNNSSNVYLVTFAHVINKKE